MKRIAVNEQYQKGYVYYLSEPAGKNFREDFSPDLTPGEMLHLGIFGGNYFNAVPKEFPPEWFKDVYLSQDGHPDNRTNYYKVGASQPLSVWQKKGWIYEEDPKGWFLWYCRYYLGRRIPEEDSRQINRWKNIKRHIAQLQRSCAIGDLSCQPRRRQVLLHWAYDSRKL